MQEAVPANELERRKQIRIRLRRDLSIEAQKYEGRTFYVVKDPVSLRYYRLKDNEHFLLQFLDGRRTLEDAQKAYEVRYRPDRLKLEDLEGFAQQLLKAGLAQNESPRAGKQLLERRTKRLRTEWLQTLTNILYIKIPVLDPDRLLDRMLGWLGWIFSFWFFALSVGVMLGAALLVATHFEMFRSKLPDYQTFFRFKTIVYMWAALGIVKVIHEFGHGLSCKVFGGEVHEMGALFLCLSPALYCNVSDAWILPSKWHRIIISAAGIYVELIIASLATFVWWNTAVHPFVNNLALSLMVVCSVSTVVFNANPLMRYDGYYVLADWLEIPNLRERSNRFLKNLVLEHCLGVEVVPEPYMALWRRVLFVSYAVVSYVYRWVVTFAILWFLYSFLRPYKLEVISQMLALAAVGSMVGWPLFRLGQNIHKRGRLPDMKRWRVVVSSSVLAALLAVVCLVPVPGWVPLPVSRVRGVGLVQPLPDSTARVFVRHPGILEVLKVRPGDKVQPGDELAVFRNRDLEMELEAARTERDNARTHLDLLTKQRSKSKDPADKAKTTQEMAKIESERAKAEAKVIALQKTQEQMLVLRAPRAGVIGLAPSVEQIGQMFEPDPSRPFCTINEPARVRVCLPLVTPEFNRLRENLEQTSEAARATRRLFRKRVSVACERKRLADALAELHGQVPGLSFRLDSESGATPDKLVSYTAKRERLTAVLEGLLEPAGLTYRVISAPGEPDDGAIEVRAAGGPERRVGLADVDIDIRVQGRDSRTWKGRIVQLPESEARIVPLALSNKAGGPVAVKAMPPTPNAANSNPADALTPQTQHYLVYVDIMDADEAILPGAMAQVKVRCRPETCLRWLWRTLNNTFDLGLL
jgi:putative peptide zinc metalloprotease protein